MPAAAQREKSDQELEIEIERDETQLHDGGHVPELVNPRKTARQFDKPDRRQEELMESEPKVFDVAFLREI